MKFEARHLSACTAVSLALIFASSPASADQIREAQWVADYLKLKQAHQISKGEGVTVAVIDSGIVPHIDLKNNLKRGIDTVPGGDGIGQLDDKDGHGTKMGGLIAGHGHKLGYGVIGIAPSAALLPIKAVSVSRGIEGITAGIEWSAKNGAKVINISVMATRGRPLEAAVSSAIRADIVIVASAGNRSENPQLSYPAAIPEVLAVGATDRNGNHADFSVSGTGVDICAPGVDMMTTFQESKYYKGSGTSEAAAVVSGAAALVRAKFPELSAPEVIHRLTATADDNGPPGRDEQCGYGVLNIVQALTAEVPPLSASGPAGSAAATATSSAGVPASAGAGTSPEVAAPEPAGSHLPLIAGIGAGIVGLGAVLAFLVRRRRRSSS